MQWQPEQRTIAGELESAFSTLLDESVKISAAGRTDAGVHATGQVISFETQKDFPFERMSLALNNTLPPDLSVRQVDLVEGKFSARFSASERTYVYLVLNRRMRSAVLQRFAYHFYGTVDLTRMETAAEYFIGEHDFRSVCGMLPASGPTLRTVRRITAQRYEDIVAITIVADGFLHRMVRNIIGTLLEVGNLRRDPHSIPAMLQARDRQAAGHTAPAHGLFLAGVKYADFDSYKSPLGL